MKRDKLFEIIDDILDMDFYSDDDKSRNIDKKVKEYLNAQP